jgi:dolichol-phosphate mannosyltransferase
MIRNDTKSIPIHKKLFSNFFYKSINFISNSKITPSASDFFLIDRHVVNIILSIQDSPPFLRGLIAWMGFKTETIPYIADARKYGQPSYTFRKSLSLAHQAIMSLSYQPLRASMYLASFIIFGCFIYSLFILGATLMDKTVPGWSSLMLTILSMSAIQLFALGVIGEYIFQIFIRSRKLPTYVTVIEPAHNNIGKANLNGLN